MTFIAKYTFPKLIIEEKFLTGPIGKQHIDLPFKKGGVVGGWQAHMNL